MKQKRRPKFVIQELLLAGPCSVPSVLARRCCVCTGVSSAESALGHRNYKESQVRKGNPEGQGSWKAGFALQESHINYELEINYSEEDDDDGRMKQAVIFQIEGGLCRAGTADAGG